MAPTPLPGPKKLAPLVRQFVVRELCDPAIGAPHGRLVRLPVEREGLRRPVDPRRWLVPVLPRELAPGDGVGTQLQCDRDGPTGQVTTAAADQKGCTAFGETLGGA